MTGRFGKPDATGRSGGRLTGKRNRFLKPPAGEPWVWLPRALLESDAWQGMSLTARRLVDFLLIEHANHAGQENGALMATHEQLERFGLSRNLIAPAIDEAEFLGIIRTQRGRMTAGEAKNPTLFRLTWTGTRDGAPPTNEWKGVTSEASAIWKTSRRRPKAVPLREDIEGPPKSAGGISAEIHHLPFPLPPKSAGGNRRKVRAGK